MISKDHRDLLQVPRFRHSFMAVLIVLAVGAISDAVRLDAIPDRVGSAGHLFTEWKGHSADVDRGPTVTYPNRELTVSAPTVAAVRGYSMFGCPSSTGRRGRADVYWARTRVLEIHDAHQASCPMSLSPLLGPDATGIGWSLRFFSCATRATARPRAAPDDPRLQASLLLSKRAGVAQVDDVGG